MAVSLFYNVKSKISIFTFTSTKFLMYLSNSLEQIVIEDHFLDKFIITISLQNVIQNDILKGALNLIRVNKKDF